MPIDPDPRWLTDDGTTDLLRSTTAVLREVRLASGLTVANLAGDVGVATSVISRALTGAREPSFRLVLALCAAMAVGPDAVLALAEREVYPLGDPPWVLDPAHLLDPRLPTA